MTKKETTEIKRAAKAAMNQNGIAVYMTNMILLESGGTREIPTNYIMFRDKSTGKEWQCRTSNGADWHVEEYTTNDTDYKGGISEAHFGIVAIPDSTAARYMEQVEQAESLDELDTITEAAANDDTLTGAEYETIHAAALCKAQEWDPQNRKEAVSATHIISGHPVTFSVCTAVAASIGDTERQPALFVHDCTDQDGNGDGVIFGVSVPPETAEEAAALLQEPIDTEGDTLKTVEGVSV